MAKAKKQEVVSTPVEIIQDGEYLEEQEIKQGKVEVLITNNSMGNHEIVRNRQRTLTILGHKKDQHFVLDSEDELKSIKKAFASKPWLVINRVVENSSEKDEA